MPRHDFARPDEPAFPAPNAGVFRLLSLLRRPVPLADLRPLATAAGMAEPELASAISTATRRQVIGPGRDRRHRLLRPSEAGSVSALAEAGVRLPHEQPGKHRLACPECDKGRDDDALQVTVTPRRWAFWKCWRCSWEGKAPLDDMPARSEPPFRVPCRKRKPPEDPDGPKLVPAPIGLSSHAQALLDACGPIVPRSPPDLYFRARGCAPPENDVLWHPALPHPSGHVGPAIVAVVTDALAGEPINLHRTWLAPDGDGKAPIAKPRLLLKGHRKHGGVVRPVPRRGAGHRALRRRGHRDGAFGRARLSAGLGLPGRRQPRRVAGAARRRGAHHRRRPRQAQPQDGAARRTEAAEACAERWAEAGAEVRIWHAPAEGDDFNDFVARAAA
jgi:hypothetical protein